MSVFYLYTLTKKIGMHFTDHIIFGKEVVHKFNKNIKYFILYNLVLYSIVKEYMIFYNEYEKRINRKLMKNV